MKIRGVMSNGMICSGKELSLNDDHDGIMIINDNSKIGENISKVLQIKDDSIFERLF